MENGSMKALVLDQPGPPSTLRVATMPVPVPGPGEIRVRVEAAGLNPVDYQVAAGGHPAWQYPFILGLDVAGTVDAVGPDVTRWNVGDAVYYHGDLTRPGGYAEYAITTAHTVAHLPAGRTFVEAAALPCAGFTAYQALYRKLHISPRQTILVQGGAGGVGGFAVQLAAHTGLRVLATCSAANAAYVRGLGAAEVIDYQAEDVGARVRELTAGRGVEALVDPISGASATAGLEMLAFGGGIACVADLPDWSQIRPFTKAVSVHEIALGAAHASGDRVAQEDLARLAVELGALLSDHKVDPMLHEIITLDEVPAALERLAGRHVRGKIVAQIRD